MPTDVVDTSTTDTTEPSAIPEAPPTLDSSANLVLLGSRIAELGLQLTQVRSKRDELSGQVTALELELMPLLQQHGMLLAAIIGRAMPTPVLTPAAPLPVPQYPTPSAGPTAPPPYDHNTGMRLRIKKYLRNVDESVSAMDIADALKVDATLVREVLLELRNSR